MNTVGFVLAILGLFSLHVQHTERVLLATISDAHKLFTARLTCLEDRMVVNVKYNDGTFTGIAYTEGSYDNAQCMKRIEKEKEFQFVVHYNECKTTTNVRLFGLKSKFNEGNAD